MVQNGEGIRKAGQFGQIFIKNRLGHILNKTECHAKEYRLHSLGNGIIKVFERFIFYFGIAV